MNFNFLDEGCVIYTIIYFFAFFSTLLVSSKGARIFCFYFIIIAEIIIGSLRGIDVGADTRGYIEIIMPEVDLYSYNEILSGSSGLLSKEPICYCFLKFISSPFVTYTPWFIILQLIFWVLVANTMLRFSKDPLLTLFVFIAFRFSFFNLSAMRQGLALAVTTFSYRYYDRGEKIPFILLIILASLFHRSAVVMLLLFFIGNIKLINRQWLVYLSGLIIAVGSLVIGNIFGFLVNYGNSELFYADYIANSKGGGNIFSIIFMLIVFILSSISMRQNNNRFSTMNIKTYNILTLAFLTAMAGFSMSIMFRISMYFGFIVPIAFANYIMEICDKDIRRKLRLMSVLLFAVIYICTGVVEDYTPYKFFWEAGF